MRFTNKEIFNGLENLKKSIEHRSYYQKYDEYNNVINVINDPEDVLKICLKAIDEFKGNFE